MRSERLIAHAWGPGASHVIEDAPGLAGLQDDGVDAIVPHHPIVRRLQRKAQGTRLPRSRRLTEQLIGVALAQKVTGINSRRALQALARRHGQPAPGPRPDLLLLPHPDDLARLPAFAFHPLGIEGHRASLVRRIAQWSATLERAVHLPPAEARAHLEKLRGIGPWTSGVVASSALGDADAVPIGDYHLPNVVAFALAAEPRATDARMMELLAPYEGQRGRVVRLLKQGGPRPPRYGPKATVRDIRGH